MKLIYYTQVRPFKALFDGRQRFHKGYPPMHSLEPVHFSPGDIVLVEAFVTRWLDVPSDEKAQYKNQPWPRWRAEFRLEAMSLLMRESTLLTTRQHENRTDA